MCRLLGYLGEELPLGRLVSAPAHSLLKQSWQARELVSATVNADGWGAGVFVPDEVEPCLYASTLPIWADANASHLGRALRSGSLVAAVRSATDPLSVAHANTQPFAAPGLLFVHNGFIERFRATVRRRLCGALSDQRFAAIAGTTDSEHLFALILEGLGAERSAEAVLRAGAAAVRQASSWAVEAGAKAHFAVVLSTPDALVAIRTATEPEPPSLYLLRRGSLAPGVIVASEPLDEDRGWERIPAGSAVIARRGAGAELVALP